VPPRMVGHMYTRANFHKNHTKAKISKFRQVGKRLPVLQNTALRLVILPANTTTSSVAIMPNKLSSAFILAWDLRIRDMLADRISVSDIRGVKIRERKSRSCFLILALR
jgi:hypothetical protein